VFGLVTVRRPGLCGLLLTCAVKNSGMSVSIEGLVGCCGSASWDDKVCVSATFETCAVVGVEGVFVWSLVNPLAGISVDIVSVFFNERSGLLSVDKCKSAERGCGWWTTWVVSAGNEGDNGCRDSTFLLVFVNYLKSFNFGILKLWLSW